jgi:hypothetical protein
VTDEERRGRPKDRQFRFFLLLPVFSRSFSLYLANGAAGICEMASKLMRRMKPSKAYPGPAGGQLRLGLGGTDAVERKATAPQMFAQCEE